MIVLGVTIFISLCLAGIFIVCFVAENARKRRSCVERDSLLPLDDSDGRLITDPESSQTDK